MAFGRALTTPEDPEDAVQLEVFADVFNILDLRPAVSVDGYYTLVLVHPIVGGTDDDLDHIKGVRLEF